MHVMSEEERRAFLVGEPRTAKPATTRKDHRPHVAPVWIDLDDDGTVVFLTGAGTLKGTSMVWVRPTHVVAQADIAG